MILQSITIQNYQSHEHTQIDLAAGLTALIGTSNAGKTSILRALNWAINNRPSGKSFIRHGTEECFVEVTTDKHVVTRYRKNGKNIYSVDSEDYTALGSNVPPQVRKALPLQDINIAPQLQPHFLILDSPGKIAKAVNDIVHLEEAEGLVDKLSSSMRVLKVEIDQGHKRENDLESVLRGFEPLEDYRHTLDAATVLETNLVGFRARLKGLDEVLDGLDDLDEMEVVIPVGMGELLDKAEEVVGTVAALRDDRDWLSQLIHDLKATEVEMPDVNGMEELIDEIAEKQKEISEKDIERGVVEITLIEIEGVDEKLMLIEGDIEVGLKTYNELLGELDVCPICEQPVDKDHRELVLENMR